MAGIKTISNTLIAQLASCAGLDRDRVQTFSGSVDDFVKGTSRVPFCGVAFVDADYEEESADYSAVEQHLNFELTIIATDFREKKYTIEDSYPLIDAIQTKITGLNLDVDGLSPFKPVSCTKHRELEAIGYIVFIMRITAWQVIQKED